MKESDIYSFPVPADYCLVIKALNDTNSLREAAQILHIDPGALARKVQKISNEFGLFYKIGNKWVATESGKKLSQWVDESISIQKLLLNQKSVIRISSDTWLTEQVLIPNFKHLKSTTKDQCHWIYKPLSENVEEEMLNSKVEFIITSHSPYDPGIAHKKITSEPWIVIAPASWENEMRGLSESETRQFLNSRPFIRPAQFFCEETLGFNPEKMAELSINDIIGLRSAVSCNLGWSCLPRLSVKFNLESGAIMKVNYQTMNANIVTLWWPRGRKDLQPYALLICEWIGKALA